MCKAVKSVEILIRSLESMVLLSIGCGGVLVFGDYENSLTPFFVWSVGAEQCF